MEKEYNPQEIEKMVQIFWEKNNTFQVTENNQKEKYYCLSMLPYPSGQLHMGHVRNYTIGDVISRYQRMLGKNVLQPIGWDAFGLPAESAAIENNIDPSIWTDVNIDYMKKQLKQFGFSYDWNREIKTSSPDYYRWEQWLFIKLYERGLVYKKKSIVNWCSYHKTVLANEQVINGCCWRCMTPIIHKNISQWYIKISSYAQELLDDLNTLTEWPNAVKTMQRNWIGRTESLEISFRILNSKKNIKIITNRPDIIMGATYIAISPHHILIKDISKTNNILYQFVIECIKDEKNIQQKYNIDIKGINTGLYAIHPITKNKLPIWIANFVSIRYNTDAIIAIPGHKKHDLEFANKYNLPIKIVIFNSTNDAHHIVNDHQNTKKSILINSGKEFNGMNLKDAKIAITNTLIRNDTAIRKITYRLQDWCISRQRYWGAPIPMLKTYDNYILPVNENNLPVIFPKEMLKNKKVYSEKINSLWKYTIINGKKVIRETDTFDTFMESSWYYARYTCPNYTKGMLKPIAVNYWLPIDQYIGGIEHAVMHLLYFRFFHKLLRDLSLVKYDEPAKKLLCQGMVLSDTFFYLNKNGQKVWVSSNNAIIKKDQNGKIVSAKDHLGNPLIYYGMHKMSKSKNNGINPQLILEKYGADAIRLFIMFAAPPETHLEWQEEHIVGAVRFIKKLWTFVYNHCKNNNAIIKHDLSINRLTDKQKQLKNELNLTIKKVTNEFEHTYSFNTAIAAIMKFINTLINFSNTQNNLQDILLIQESLNVIIRLLSPIIPHACFIMWKALGNTTNIDFTAWPTASKEIKLTNNIQIIIQINGKIRGRMEIDKNATKEFILTNAIKKKFVLKNIKNNNIKNVIYINGKVLNIVTT
uniref:Leucine--tRNA ligase n=1 Tax=Candidatus Aschnera chinzeii TaxID=1485666 RepID=A0AAT9G4G3_9ENTR|nr:MAG: leucine--tRNA ligase [Candidatus Aschnera chinzeii]